MSIQFLLPSEVSLPASRFTTRKPTEATYAFKNFEREDSR
jgi:hypothetical protein